MPGQDYRANLEAFFFFFFPLLLFEIERATCLYIFATVTFALTKKGTVEEGRMRK